MSEIELQLRFDPDGRTIASEEFYSKIGESNKPNNEDVKLDYKSQTIDTLINEETDTKLLDDILFDCEITDCALLPRTFWCSSDSQPRCVLERMALEVFKHHAGDAVYDPATSGAEFWVQIRPSPPAGRYRLLHEDDKKKNTSSKDDDVDLESTGICFHWDKDEDLRLMMGGQVYVHPHISTVTYLSSIGAPTMAINYRVNPLNGEYIDTPIDDTECFISWPKKGKHLSFDGRYLHAAPSNLMPSGEFEKQTKVRDDLVDEDERKKQMRRQRRVTFLVNVWLNYKPFNVEPFPESMMDKMTKISEDTMTAILLDPSNKNVINEKKVETLEVNDPVTGFKWSMGGTESSEYIKMELPLASIQNELQKGGNIEVKWKQYEGRAPPIELLKGEDVKSDESLNCNDQKKQKIAK